MASGGSLDWARGRHLWWMPASHFSAARVARELASDPRIDVVAQGVGASDARIHVLAHGGGASDARIDVTVARVRSRTSLSGLAARTASISASVREVWPSASASLAR